MVWSYTYKFLFVFYTKYSTGLIKHDPNVRLRPLSHHFLLVTPSSGCSDYYY